MSRLLTVCGVLLALTVFGCKPSEETKSTKTEPEKTGQKMEQLAKSAAEETREAAAAAVEKTEKMAQEATKESRQMVTESVSASTPPESLVFEASYGTVTFPHGMHAESFDCATCHGEGPPAAFGLDKDTAHELCKGCHQDQGAGPTNCRDCHKKQG